MATSPAPRALVIGNSDGIGLALSRLLVADGCSVTGVSRSASPVGDLTHHVVLDVTAPDYRTALGSLVDGRGPFDWCVYCVGVGEELDPRSFAGEVEIVAANFTAAVATLEVVVPRMVREGRGHVVGLSSLADGFRIAGAPSYAASKAGLSSYLESVALGLRPHGVFVTNVRFGFVDTKLAKADRRPLMISAERAARVVLRCLERKPIRCSYPRTAAALAWLGRGAQALRLWFA